MPENQNYNSQSSLSVCFLKQKHSALNYVLQNIKYLV